MSAPVFSPDPNLQSTIDSHAAKAIDAAMTRFSVMLDFSDDGIQHVDDILQKLAAEIARLSPPPERVLRIATAFGCYVGETFRRNHGGQWGTVTAGERKTWGVMAPENRVLALPIGMVQKRLTSANENLLEYYRSLLPQRPAASHGMNFTADPNIQKIAEAYSLDAVDFAKNACRITLDWSDQSVRYVEDLLVKLGKEMARSKPTEEQIFGMAKMLGSYVGEVYRKTHGGQWGIIDWNGQQFPGIKKGDVTFWPWGKVNNRLTNGPEDNVWHYYQAILKDDAKPV